MRDFGAQARKQQERFRDSSPTVTEEGRSRQVTDNTLPAGPIERTIVYHAPFTRCDRERDYATVWKSLESLGSK